MTSPTPLARGPVGANPFVGFYRDNEISPVAQDISDLDRHFARREALYRHVGLPPRLLAGRSVIEFGPGSGHNAVYTASLRPARYILVDGNPVGLERTQRLLAEHRASDLEFAQSMIEDYTTDERFDVVLCEGAIPLQIDPVSISATSRRICGGWRRGGHHLHGLGLAIRRDHAPPHGRVGD